MFGLNRRPKLLSERQEAILAEERQMLERLQQALKDFGVDVAPGDTHILDETIAHLGEIFLLVIVGEFNSGKSSFINALLGEQVVAEGVLPTTDRITLLRYGEQPNHESVGDYTVEHQHPADLLRRMTVVDTPGVNAIIRRHEELTREFIPRADLVLFVTSADRPFTESERAFLELIREWGKKIVIVLNKVDLIQPAEREQIEQYIRENTQKLLNFTPDILAISSRQAQQSRASNDEALWQTSRFEQVDRYLVEQLDQEQRIRLKLSSPLGVAKRLCDKYLLAAEGRLSALQSDVATIENIERQLDVFREDLGHDYSRHQRDVETILADFEARGNTFFEQTITVRNAPRLIRDSDGIRIEFEDQVVGDLPRQLEGRVQNLIDWMVEKNLKLWQTTIDYLKRERLPLHQNQLIGEIGGSFEYNRSALVESVAHKAQTVVERYDRQAESAALAEELRGAVAGTALVGAGAIGVGALLVVLLHTAALDFTGILAAGVLAAGGLFIIPNKRRQVKKQFHEKVVALRDQLNGAMRRAFDQELDQMLTRLREAIAPYTRFVRAQREQLIGVQRVLSDIDVDLERLTDSIER
ncbi:MAG: dynamin family protein [Roseiflexaceae bacterium]